MELGQYRVTGRYVNMEDALWLTMSAATVAFQVEGAGFCRILLKGDNSATDPEKETLLARYAVMLDGRVITDERLDAAERTVAVFEGETGEKHEVKVIKLSESTRSNLGFAGVETDGVIRPVPEKARKLKVIGDSITCGYGVEGDLTQTFTTRTENAMKAYGYLTADALDADVELVSFSGFGILSGYTDTGIINTDCLVPTYYEKAGLNDFVFPDGTKAEDHMWNFDTYQPDTVVINLGTNDLSYCKEDTDKKKQYRELYKEFLKTVRKHDPQAKILCILGVMGMGLNDQMADAVAEYSRETGDARIRARRYEEQSAEDGYGTDYHPSEVTQVKLAEKVVHDLKEWDTEEQK